MTMTITRFDKEYRWLSNFWPAKVTYDGVGYPTVEHAYQAAKCEKSWDRQMFLQCKTPGEARRLGRKVRMRSDWESMKRIIMERLLRQKFEIPELRAKLIDTNDAKLVEGNYWHDNFWGVCQCDGCASKAALNHLGKLIMLIRDEIRKET